ncbi:DUF4292 domain-containing protein [Sphingobacterium sp.]|uniref:DUF4292 domain-containing protein n=1 Tax=Sphingobacterium sp. TaxID=341027 RepID=UPI0028AC4D50|nr:DUF4292 domain-containing protein [Sphingobacterium sp.]
MRRNILSKISLVLAVLMLASACASKKASVKKEDAAATAKGKDLLSTYELNNLNFITFSGRAKARVQFGEETQNVTLNVRMERDKAIWISVTALLGIEAARVLITPDSVKIINRLQSEYIAKPFSYIYRYTNPGISFRMLQDILVGNISTEMLRTDQLQIATSEDDVQVIGVKDGLTFHYGVNKSNRPTLFNLMELGKSNKLEAQYSEFAVIDGHNFPQRFTLNIEGSGAKVSSDMLYNKSEFNKSVELNFSIPSRYKAIN